MPHPLITQMSNGILSKITIWAAGSGGADISFANANIFFAKEKQQLYN